MTEVMVPTGYSPRKHQIEAHLGMAKSRFSILVCHRRFGKTVLAVNALINGALSFHVSWYRRPLCLLGSLL